MLWSLRAWHFAFVVFMQNIPNEGDYAWTGLCESVEAVVCEDNVVLVVVILS